MARKKSRRRGLPAPSWSTPPGERPSVLDEVRDADEAWALGTSLEEAYDFPGAHHAYQDAMRRRGATLAPEVLLPYAAFVVERYGQFTEAAAWLQTPGWTPDVLVDADATLAALIARAADEASHPDREPLDAALAAHGEPEALARQAQRLVDRGEDEAARALLERHRAALQPASSAARLLETLVAAGREAAEAAHEPVRRAMEARDVEAAEAQLNTLAAQWADDGLHRGLRREVEALAVELAAESQREALSAALDRDDLDEAIRIANKVAQGPTSNEADAATLRTLQARRAEADVRARREALHAAQDDHSLFAALLAHRGSLDALRALVDAGDTRLVELAPPSEHADRAGLIEAVALQDAALLVRDDAAASLAALAGLQAGTPTDDARADDAAMHHVADRLDALPPAWRAARPARKARQWLDGQESARQRAAEERAAGEIRMLLISGDLAGARARVAAAFADHPDSGEALRTVRDDVQQAADREARRAALAADVERALADGALFAAQRAARQLAAIDSDAADEARPLLSKIETAMTERLSAKPVPPFAASLSTAPVAFGVVGGRLLLVQGSTWLAINLETGGLRPYQLPDGWALDARPAPRIHDADGTAWVVGRSAGRVVKLRALPDEPPRVVEAREIRSILGTDEVLSALAVEPDAAAWTALGRHREPGRVPTVHALNPDDLSARESRRVKPAIWHLCGVRHGGGGALAASRPQERKPGQWAVALLDARGKVRERFEQTTLQEPVAYPTEAVAWPEESLVFARYTWLDMFDPERVHAGASLLVLREGRVVFASADLRKRFAPTDPIVVDGGWAFDRVSGRLWFAARHRDDAEADAMLLGVEARRLRADAPTPVPGARALLGIEAVDDGAVALYRSHEGGFGVVRLQVDDGEITMRTQKLPVAATDDA